jgi:hypothetical protein
MSGRDPVDLMGLPRIEAVKKEDTPRGGYGLYPEDCDYLTKWAQPSMLPRKGKRPSILFLDEINRGTQMVLNVCLQLVQDRRIGDYVLPDDCVVMAAGNPESDPGVIKMSSAMKERFQHVHLEIDTDDWCSWALSAGIDPIVIAFIRFRPELLHRFDPKELKSPNPRNWQFVSEIIAVDPAPHIEHEMFVGALGKAAVKMASAKPTAKFVENAQSITLTPEYTAWCVKNVDVF